MAEVVIAIPTFRRPKGLTRLLDSLAALQTVADVAVIVADNDGEGRQGFAICERYRSEGYRWPLDALVVAERGISHNRNALVARALADPAMRCLVMLDDDEWVAAPLAGRVAAHAVAVPGRCRRRPGDRGARPTARKSRDYEGATHDRGASAPVDLLQSTANVLITRRALEWIAPPLFRSAIRALRRRGQGLLHCA